MNFLVLLLKTCRCHIFIEVLFILLLTLDYIVPPLYVQACVAWRGPRVKESEINAGFFYYCSFEKCLLVCPIKSFTYIDPVQTARVYHLIPRLQKLFLQIVSGQSNAPPITLVCLSHSSSRLDTNNEAVVVYHSVHFCYHPIIINMDKPYSLY